MKSILILLDSVVSIYIWILIINAILSWLIAFNVLNTSNRLVYSILDISYRDTEKDDIIPALNKMTEVYQRYSGKANRRNLELSKSFLENQIQEYKTRVDESIKLAQDYAIDQDLSILDLVLKGGGSLSNPLNFNF